MRGEHQDNGLVAQRLVDGRRRDAGIQQRLQRAVGGLYRATRDLAQALQALTLAVRNLLRQVVQVEQVGEGGGDAGGGGMERRGSENRAAAG